MLYPIELPVPDEVPGIVHDGPDGCNTGAAGEYSVVSIQYSVSATRGHRATAILSDGGGLRAWGVDSEAGQAVPFFTGGKGDK